MILAICQQRGAAHPLQPRAPPLQNSAGIDARLARGVPPSYRRLRPVGDVMSVHGLNDGARETRRLGFDGDDLRATVRQPAVALTRHRLGCVHRHPWRTTVCMRSGRRAGQRRSGPGTLALRARARARGHAPGVHRGGFEELMLGRSTSPLRSRSQSVSIAGLPRNAPRRSPSVDSDASRGVGG